MGIVYKITNQINGKVYVGMTEKSLLERFKEHSSWARSRYYSVTLLFRAIRKHGPENFAIEEIARANSRADLAVLEMKYISELRSHLPDVGYNLTLGGDGGSPNAETRQKISKSMKQAMTQEVKERIASSLRGKPLSESHRKAISSGNNGKRLSASHKEAISDAKTQMHCKNGHLLSDDNVYVSGRSRRCKTCTKNRAKVWRKTTKPWSRRGLDTA